MAFRLLRGQTVKFRERTREAWHFPESQQEEGGKVRRFLTTVGLCAALGLALPATTQAGTFTFSLGTAGTGHADTISFTDSGSTLTVVLSNVGGDVLVPTDVLTAVFFNCSCGSLTSTSAVETAGSTTVFDPDGQPAGGVVGGEWAYSGSIGGGPGGATRGISSTGLNFFGGPTFPGPDLDPPTAVNGLNYGLLSAVDNLTTGNSAVTGGGGNPVPYVQNSVTFTFGGYTGGPVTSSTFSNITFQYGTALNEPQLGGGTGSGGGSGQTLVPEPASLLLFGSGLVASAYRARRKKKQ